MTRYFIEYAGDDEGMVVEAETPIDALRGLNVTHVDPLEVHVHELGDGARFIVGVEVVRHVRIEPIEEKETQT